MKPLQDTALERSADEGKVRKKPLGKEYRFTRIGCFHAFTHSEQEENTEKKSVPVAMPDAASSSSIPTAVILPRLLCNAVVVVIVVLLLEVFESPQGYDEANK